MYTMARFEAVRVVRLILGRPISLRAEGTRSLLKDSVCILGITSVGTYVWRATDWKTYCSSKAEIVDRCLTNASLWPLYQSCRDLEVVTTPSTSPIQLKRRRGVRDKFRSKWQTSYIIDERDCRLPSYSTHEVVSWRTLS